MTKTTESPIMTKDEVMLLAEETVGKCWMDEAHIQRFARRLIEITVNKTIEHCSGKANKDAVRYAWLRNTSNSNKEQVLAAKSDAYGAYMDHLIDGLMEKELKNVGCG